MARMARTDTRRYRKVNPLGPNPEEQAKLLGECSFWKWHDGYNQSLHALHERIAQKEMKNPDMTSVPRRIDRTVRLYLLGCTVTVSEILGDEELVAN